MARFEVTMPPYDPDTAGGNADPRKFTVEGAARYEIDEPWVHFYGGIPGEGPEVLIDSIRGPERIRRIA